MKKLFYLLLLFISVNGYSQVYIGADGAMHPSGNYFAGKQGEFQSGLFLLTRISERDSIPVWQRTFGMLVYVRNTDSIYALKSPTLDNSNWTNFTAGSSSGNIDLSTLVKYIDTASMLANRLKISDTSNMLSGYAKVGQFVSFSDTASMLLSRLRILDTSAMLSGYAKNGMAVQYTDTANMLLGYLRVIDTAAMLSGYAKNGTVVKYSDTATMLAGYAKSADNLNNVKYSDTALMLSNRLKISDTTTMLAGYAKASDNLNNAKYSDTASMLSNRLKISDTTTMLAGYTKASDNLNNVKYSDTASMLSNRLKISDTTMMLAGYAKASDNLNNVKYNDTASMLSNRLKISDTTTMLAGYAKASDNLNNVKYADTVSILSNRLKISDTATMLSAYSKGINNVKYADTASMLSNRLKISDTTTMLAGYAKASDNLNNVKYADTASMLSNRLKISDTTTMLAGYAKALDNLNNVKYADTASMLSNRLKISDTATMLSAYSKGVNNVKYADTASMLSNRLKISDTTTMLAAYSKGINNVKYADTTSMLSNRLKISDTATMLAGYGKSINNVKYSDTASMLFNRLKISDTTAMLSGYAINGAVVKYTDTSAIVFNRLKISDTAAMMVTRLKTTDTASMLSGYQRLGTSNFPPSVYNQGISLGIGTSSLRQVSTGAFNVAYGDSSLKLNTSGFHNTAVGSMSMAANTSGSRNAATGYQSLFANTTGGFNTANGFSSLRANTTGANNTALGYQSLLLNTTASNNTATGYQSLLANTTGAGNTANGSGALLSNSTGRYNTGVGFQALNNNTAGNNNVAVGDSALYQNDGDRNVAVGNASMAANTYGGRNTAIGDSALATNTTGNNLSALGRNAGRSNTTGNNNTFIGNNAGFTDGLVTTPGNLKHATAIGNNAQVTTDSALVLGGTGLNSVRVGIGTTSPDVSAILDLTSLKKGFLLPRMSTEQRDSIVSPANGLQVYNTTTNTVDVYNGAEWIAQGAGGGGGASVQYSDTASMLANYANFNHVLKLYDTAAMLSNYSRITNTFQFSDTANMLANYARKQDLSGLLRVLDTATMLSGYARNGTLLSNADTASMLANYARFNHVLKLYDTAAMLSNYARIANTFQFSDTAFMLANYARKADFLRQSDTAAMLSGYGRSGQVVKYSDTSAMLSNFLHISDTAAMMATRVKTSDTSNMLVNRLKISDTASMLSGYVKNNAIRKDSAWLRVNSIDPATNNLDSLYTMGKVGIGTSNPHNSAILDLTSLNQGFLMPRMSTTQRDAILNPSPGLQIYNSTTNLINYYNGVNWSVSSIRDTIVYTNDDSIGLVTPASINIKAGAVTVGAGQLQATAPTLTFSSNITAGQPGWLGSTRFAYNDNGFLISHDGSTGNGSAPKGFGLGTGARANDIFISDSGRVGIGLPLGSLPVAKLHNAGSTIFGTKIHNDVPGGVIGTAANTVDSFTVIAIPQITAGQTISLPNPSNTTPGRIVSIINTGNTWFNINGLKLSPGYSHSVIWNGTAWVLNGDGAGVGVNFIPYVYNEFNNYMGLGMSSLSANTAAGVTAFGDSSLTANVTGINNTAVGFGTLKLNTGANNTAIGYKALYSNTTGVGNTALGNQALLFNTTGTRNVAIGQRALTANTSGTNNHAVGFNSLALNTTGSFNNAYGNLALWNNTTGSGNIAMGAEALMANQTGNNNIGLGGNALEQNTTGSSNIAIGNKTMLSSYSGNKNIAIGDSALLRNGADKNIAIGHQSLLTNTTGTNNTAIGDSALGANTTASNNTALGKFAGRNNTTGTGNVFIGNNAGYTDGTVSTSATINHATAIGNNAQVTTDSSIVLGGTGVNAVRVGVGTTAPHSSALLDLTSTVKGFLMPRMTVTERDAIVAPATGLQVYNTTTGTVNTYNGTGWTTQMAGVKSTVNIIPGDTTVGSGPTAATAPSLTFSSNVLGGPGGWNGNTRFSYNNAGFYISHNGSSGPAAAPYGFGLGTGGRQNDLFIGATGNVGIHLPYGAEPSATFQNGGSTLFTTLPVANLATGGVIGTAGTTVDSFTVFAVNQTTAGQTLSLPAPTNITAGRVVSIMNTGSAFFTMNTGTIYPGTSQSVIWNGTAWALNGDGGGGITGGGTIDYLPRFTTGSVVANSTLQDNGSLISTTSPNGILATGSFGVGAIGNGVSPAIAGAGTRMMWMPSKGSFRAGTVTTSQWDSASIGNYSVAFGYNNTASGASATALGNGNTVSGSASGALGQTNTVIGNNSTAIGFGNYMTGNKSTAFGNNVAVAGDFATAIGFNVSAAQTGSMILGDSSGTTMQTDTKNQFMSRFAGGYKIFTTGGVGLQIAPGGYMRYNANYGSLMDARSLVDKGYVDSIKSTIPAGAGGSFTGSGTANYLTKFTGTTAVGNSVLMDNGSMISMNAANGFLATGTYGAGSIGTTGAGSRMMWYPGKASFRAGNVSSSYWDDANIGAYSIALGQDVMASGTGSVSIGSNNTSTGQYSTTFGYGNNATTTYTTAFGQGNTASAQYATAFGRGNNANGQYSTAFGYNNTSSGTYSTVFGTGNTASGTSSLAAGSNAIAQGNNTVAIGNLVHTNGYTGSMILGDGSGSWTYSDVANQMRMRFVGGYKFNTDANATMGMQLIGSTGVLKYMGNYALNYDARSLVDKGYVDSLKATMTSGAGGLGTLNFVSKFSAGGMINSSIKDTSWLSITANNGILATGTYGSNGVPAIAGAGTRMMWMPSRGAFRAGYVSSSYWDSTNVGAYSIALGQDVMASGTGSVSIGSNNTSTGQYSTTFGYGNNATTHYTTAFGQGNTASAQYATAFGRGNTVNGQYATAFGYNNTSSGTYSTVFGTGNTASGTSSLAAGSNAIAQGNNTVAIGNLVHTNGYTGSMILGDGSGSWTYSDVANQMRMRFVGGYKFNTDANATMGIQLVGSNGVLKYMGNYALNYDARSLVDKGYVDSIKATLLNGAGAAGTLNYLSKFSAGGMINSTIKDSLWVSTNAANGVLATGTYGLGGVPAIAGSGVRMMWMPSRGAFRAGSVSSSYWDSTNVGAYSIALGQDVMASGTGSVSIGSNNTSTGQYSTTFGYGNNATTHYTTAFGQGNTASAQYATAFGRGNTVNGQYATAFGYNNTSSGTYSTVFGTGNTASGTSSLAAGSNAIAQGNNTVAIGNLVHTNGYTGSIILGDGSGSWTYSDVANQMRMRFVGGYKFNTDANATMGMQLIGSTGVLKYMGNYALNYDARSLVDKGYVDSVKATMTSGAGGFGTNNFHSKFSATGLVNSLIQDNGVLISTAAQNGILATGTYGTGAVGTGSAPAISGAGTRMMWVPSRGSFRAGYVSSSYWDSTNIGAYSIALGQDVMASGTGSVSIGSNNTSTGQYSTTFGYGNNATTHYTTAFGQGNTASAQYATAFGRGNTVNGQYATAFGYNNTSSGTYSTVFGTGNTASGTSSLAAGSNAIAQGNNTVAIGNLVHTNGYTGSMILGDGSGSWTYSDVANQMRMRFVGGYKFNTDANATMGMQLIGSTGVLKYMGNYALNYDARSLVDKGYVDSLKATMTSGAGGIGTLNFVPKFTAGGMINSSIKDTSWLSITANNGILATGTYGSNGIPAVAGAGTRMMWMPSRGSFRAGTVSSSYWDSASIGAYSIALGQDVMASGTGSVSIGSNNTSTGQYSTTFGYGNNATTHYTTAFGQGNTASAQYATAFGRGNNANGQYSTAFGYNNTSSGTYSTVFGTGNTASGTSSLAAGSNAIAQGNNTVAIGNLVHTNGYTGSMILGDGSGSWTYSDVANQMRMRFVGGYKFNTDANATMGIQLVGSNGVLKYMGNYALNYDARSLVDKGYVDSIKNNIISGGGTGIANYLSKFTGSSVTNSTIQDNGILISTNAANGILATGAYGLGGVAPIAGAGTRMVWMPSKAAFRAGHVSSSYWDSTNVGAYSIALGQDVMASGTGAVSIGSNNTSTGQYSTTFGYGNNATTTYTTAFGQGNTASAQYATAFGRGNNANGQYSTAFGYNNTSSGTYSTVFGTGNTASGTSSLAAGSNAIAQGNNTVAIGNLVHTNGYTGSMILGDGSGSWTYSDVANQMRMRFVGGYKFNTDANATMGMQLIGSTGVLKYMGNYALNYDARSLVDKGYVDSVKATMTSGAGGLGTLNFVPKFSATGMINSSIKDTTWLGITARNGVLSTGTFGTNGVPAVAGAGTRMVWMPSKAAFRAGYVNSTQWDSTSIGNYSVAMGNNTTASGSGATALGVTTIASNVNAMAFGTSTTASGQYSTAGGYSSTASGNYATAIGYGNTASGLSSTALGNNVSTNGLTGAFIVGDGNMTVTSSDLANQMKMRFSGGYKFFTDAAGNATGLQITPAGVIKYNSNYVTSYDARTLVDKNYVDSIRANIVTAGGTATFNYLSKFNGTAVVNSSIKDTSWISIVSNNGVLATGTFGANGVPAVAGAGSRMVWMPSKGAFRAGYVAGATWDSASIGNYSVAFGNNTTASGSGATAFGSTTIASNVNAMAFGTNTTASGQYATAGGYSSTASGNYATAIGYGNTASGLSSTAIGNNVSTNGLTGAFIIGDGNVSVTTSDLANQMKMRFSGGYKLFTDASATVGTQIAAGGNSWATISDRNKKENFIAVDGESFLNKIATMPLTSWNYKGQDAKKFRHYGPMAQDFFAAFGKDGMGVIGNDTTINQADFQGVSFVAIQALEKRSSGLKKEVDQVKSENMQIKSENELLKKQNEQLLNSLNAIQEKLDKQMKELAEKIKAMETKGNK